MAEEPRGGGVAGVGERPETRQSLYGLTPQLVRAVSEALESGRLDAAREIARPLHPADLADLLERLEDDQRAALLRALREAFDPEVLAWLGEADRNEVIELIGTDRLAKAISELATDDAVHVLEHLKADEQRQVLDEVPAGERALLEQGLEFAEDTAGRLMQRELVAVPPHWTVGQTIDYLRSEQGLPEEFYEIFVVDPRYQPIGTIALSRLLRSKRPVKVTRIMTTDFRSVPAATDQEEVANLFRQYGLVSAPVVSDNGRLIGVLTADDVVGVIDEEAAEDILRLGGVAETGINRPVRESVRNRFNWLFVNLVTAFLAAAVISIFQGTLQKFVALAVLMPITASQGGNAGTQTLTVVVRAIAVREITLGDGWRILRKEAAIGLINGLLFALLTGGLAWGWFHEPQLGLIIGLAMVINLVAAAVAGTLIPMGLERLGFDPAIASVVFLTTVTDCVGFFAFLGLATIFLL
jgi:magnesium transporter